MFSVIKWTIQLYMFMFMVFVLFCFRYTLYICPLKVLGNSSAKDLTVSKNSIIEIHIFPYLENNFNFNF